ncbi:MAG: hypothetical protein LBB76_04040 [Azoarcus sp.]|jgi:hypothetical protein|nr:hypothetical protein [Azoarcus sp.]
MAALSSPLDAALDWLSGDPGDDPDAELAALLRHAGLLEENRLSPSERRETLRLLHQRTLDISERLRPRLLATALPCPRDLYLQVSTLVDVLLALSGHLKDLLNDQQRRLWNRQSDLLEIPGMALVLLGDAYLLSILVGNAAPFGLWQQAHAAWLVLGQHEPLKKDSIESLPQPSVANLQYRRLLAMAVSQTEGLTAREQQWLFDYLEMVVGEMTLAPHPLQPARSAWWVDTFKDMAPVACALRMPGAQQQIIYFSPASLAKHLDAQILWLEEGLLDTGTSRDGGEFDVGSSELPVGLTPSEVLSLLRRLRTRWSLLPVRVGERSQQHYTVQICAGLKAIWGLEHEHGTTAFDEWTVYNESPNGYAILRVGGKHRASLEAGMVLALRREQSQPWSVCVVRWIKTNSTEQVELGLQVLAQGFTPVLIGFRGTDALTPALLLQSRNLRPALLTTAGAYTSNQFLLVRETANLYVVQAKAVGLDLQTSCIELFQYEIDHYPHSSGLTVRS